MFAGLWVKAVSEVLVTIPNLVASLRWAAVPQASFTNHTQSVTLSRELLLREAGWI